MRLLRNRVMLITEPVVQAKTAAIGFWFSVGSRLEKEGEYGITHFTEHMIFKGTKTRTAHEISCLFDTLGGYVNAFTEREDVCVYCTIPALEEKSIERAVDVLCDMASNATFDPQEMEKERAVIQSEIIAAQDDPEEAALDEVALAVWPEQSISRSIGGSVDDVASITREALADWYEKNFVHGELVVCAAGRFDEAVIARLLEQLPLHKKPLSVPSQSHYDDQHPRWQAGSSYKEAPFKQEQLFVLFPYQTPVLEKEYYAMAVFNALTGDTMSSRLFETLREKSGLCYTVYSFFTFYEDACAWCAYASSEKKKAKEVITLLNQEIQKLSVGMLSDAEIDAAKEHLCGEETIGGEDMEYRMKRLSRNCQMGFPFRDTESTIECIRSVSKNDIVTVIKKLLDAKNRAFISYGPRLPLSIRKEK